MRVLAWLATLAACSEDPSLRVRIDYERPPVPYTVISVYESPTATCDDIELGDLDEAQLAALLVAEQTIGTVENGALDNISRTDPKLVVARAYAETGELLEGGCAPHGLVVENDEVTVKTHVIATVSAAPDPTTPGFDLGVLITDRDGRPLDDRRPISWRMYGPYGSEPTTRATEVVETEDGSWRPAEHACAGGNGLAVLTPITPNVVGGFATSVRVAWANQLPTLFSGITNTDFALTNLTIPAETRHPCAVAVHTDGGVTTKRLVCVDQVGPMTIARAFAVDVVGGAARLTPIPPPQPLGRPPVALLAIPPEAGSTDRHVYSLDSDGELHPLFEADGVDPTNCTSCAGNVVDAMVAPACGRDEARLLVRVARTGQSDALFVKPVAGGPAVPIDVGPETMLTLQLNNAGCVTANGPQGYEPRQLVVLDLSGPTLSSTTRGFYNCTTTCRRVEFPIPESAIAFTKSSPPYVIGTDVDATGIVLATWGLLPDPSPQNPLLDRLVERDARVPSAAVPNRLAVGKFDEGDGADMIWDLGLRGRAGATFELAYSKPIETGRLQALSGPQPITVLDLIATDVDGDDYDDIIIVAKRAGPTEAGVAVVPTHAIAPPLTIPGTGCGS